MTHLGGRHGRQAEKQKSTIAKLRPEFALLMPPRFNVFPWIAAFRNVPHLAERSPSIVRCPVALVLPHGVNSCGGEIPTYDCHLPVDVKQREQAIADAAAALEQGERKAPLAKLREGSVEVMPVLEEPVAVALVKIVPIQRRPRLRYVCVCVCVRARACVCEGGSVC